MLRPPPGTVANRPFRLCAVTDCRSFGDYINALFFVNSVAAQFQYHEISLIFRGDCDFKTSLLSLIRPKQAIVLPPGAPLPPLDLFTNYGRKKMHPHFEKWFNAGLVEQDLVLVDSMMSPELLSSFDSPGFLSIPDEDVQNLAAILSSQGLWPNAWFACIHCREPGYKYKPEGRNFRDANPAGFLKLRDYIIDELGGQVVRLGHPQMTPFPPRPGYVDLSRDDGNSLLQAFAVSRSRFVVATPSGADPLGHAFGVPTATVNSVNYWQTNAHDLRCTVDVEMKDGTVLRNQALMDAGLDKLAMFDGIKEGRIAQVIQNSPATLIGVARQLHTETKDVTAWRRPIRLKTGQPNGITWPRRPVNRVRFFSDPNRAGP